MANVVGDTYLTLKDKLALTDGDGKITSQIIDLLTVSNELLLDAVAVECNSGSVNRTSVRNGLPEGEFRTFYGGVNCTKGEYTQIQDSTGMLETYSETDKDLVDLSKNPQQMRLIESEAHLQGMNNTLLKNIFYGNKATNPASFDGLANRYKKISSDPDDNTIASRCIDAGGQGDDNTSIWFITWGQLHTHLLYPENSKAGIKHEDLGRVETRDANGKLYPAYRDHYKWDVGLGIRNFKSTCRICNISIGALKNEEVDLINLLLDAYYQIEEAAKGGKTIIYANKTIRSFLHKQIINKKNVELTVDTFGGKPLLKFLELPIRGINQILNTEQRVLTI